MLALTFTTIQNSCLNIQEIAFPTAGTTASSTGGIGSGVGTDNTAAAGKDAVAAVAKPKEKTIFIVKLKSFNVGSKPKVIKEVKAMVPNPTLIKVHPCPIFLV